MSMTSYPVTDFDFSKALGSSRLKGLWVILSDYRGMYLIATVCLGIAAISKTGTYLLLRFFIDSILIQAKYDLIRNSIPLTLTLIAVGFILLASIEGTFSFLSGRLASRTSESITLRLRNFLFDHIQRLPFSYHDKTQTGELIERATSDVDALRRFFSDQAIGIGRIFILFTVNFITILRLNEILALVSIIVVPIIVLTSIYFFRKVTKVYEAYQQQEAILSSTLQENLTGVRVVKAFARQEYEKDKFERENKEKFNRGKKLLTMHTLFWPLSDIFCGFQMLGGYIVAAIMAINGSITVGDYMAYAGLVVWLIWPMRNLGRLIVQTSTGIVSYQRVMDIIIKERESLTEGSVSPKKEISGSIIFNNVGFEYESGDIALEGISFSCSPGQAVALLGSTGSGKSTLVNLLPRFYEYTQGSIKLDGIELINYPRLFLRKMIGIVEQEPFLFSRSLRENISYGVGRDISQEEVEEAAKAAAIHDVIMSFPEGYNTLVGERGVTLSGGQRQRVAIARTLLKDPRILILDDSTSSVDTETEAAIRSALECLRANRTTFIIAHRIQSVMNADMILVMDKGKIIQKGTHEELLNQDGIYKKIYEIQMLIETQLEKETSLS